MKKFSSVFFFSLLLLCGTVFAQEKSDKPNFWFGPKVGLDLATPTIDQNSIKNPIRLECTGRSVFSVWTQTISATGVLLCHAQRNQYGE